VRLFAEEATIPVWDNNYLKLDVETIGLKGSPTRVMKIFHLSGKRVRYLEMG